MALIRHYWPAGFLAILLLFSVYQHHTRHVVQIEVEPHPTRIISLAPNITETLFAIGAIDQLIAVTDYCLYPAQHIQELPRIGGYLDPSLEHIATLQPDLVILLRQQQRAQQQLTQLGIPTLIVENGSLTQILQSIEKIGEATGHQQQAATLLADIKQRINTIQSQVANEPRPATMVVVAHYTDSEQLHHLYLAGQHDFYNDLLQLAGGENVYQDSLMTVPTISLEGLFRLNPEVIIDIFPAPDTHPADVTQIKKQWQSLSAITAVQNQQLHMIEADYAVIPGPRIIQLLEDFVQILHPDITIAKPDNHDDH